MNFLLFFASYCINPLILYKIPNQNSIEFLNIFTWSNILISLFCTFYFSKIETAQKPNLTLKAILITSTLTSVFIFFGSSNSQTKIVGFFYVFSSLFGDYITTQTEDSRRKIFYRLFLLISGILTIGLSSNNFMTYIFVRSLAIVGIALLTLLQTSKMYNLNVNGTLRYIGTTYIFYSGTLLGVTYNQNFGAEGMKIWYISIQICLGVLLKSIDFLTRHATDLSTKKRKVIILISFFIISPASIFYFNIINIALGLLSIVALGQLLISL